MVNQIRPSFSPRPVNSFVSQTLDEDTIPRWWPFTGRWRLPLDAPSSPYLPQPRPPVTGSLPPSPVHWELPFPVNNQESP